MFPRQWKSIRSIRNWNPQIWWTREIWRRRVDHLQKTTKSRQCECFGDVWCDVKCEGRCEVRRMASRIDRDRGANKYPSSIRFEAPASELSSDPALVRTP